MASNTTSIKGVALNDHCKMQAAYLSQLIYKNPPGKEPFRTCYPDKIKEAEENWDVWRDFSSNSWDENAIGCRFYKPKGFKEGQDNDEAMCWPTLVFRGTEISDFSNIAFWFAIRSLIREDDLVRDGLREEGEPYFEHVFTFDNTLKAPPPGGYTKKNLSEYSGKKFFEIPMIKTEPYPIVNKYWQDIHSVEASLLIAEEGDWSNNVLLGKNSRQHTLTMNICNTFFLDYIMEEKIKRLNITGHSNGAALAAVANYMLRYLSTKMNNHIYSVLFNPLGNHYEVFETVKKECQRIIGQDLNKTANEPNISDALIDNICVKDEILTTAEYHREDIPFLGPALSSKLKKQQLNYLPIPAGNRITIIPHSPGPLNIESIATADKTPSIPGAKKGVLSMQDATEAFNKFFVKEWKIPTKGDRLPNIFPIYLQTAFTNITHNFKILLQLNKWCYDPDTLFANIQQFAVGGSHEKLRLWADIIGSEPTSDGMNFVIDSTLAAGYFAYGYVAFLEALDLAALLRISTLYHGMDYVIASYEMHLKGEVGTTEEERQEEERRNAEAMQNGIDSSRPNRIEIDNGIGNFFLNPSALRGN